MEKELELLLKKSREEKKLIHCITHWINMKDMANVILALGQSPIMADNEEEVSRITAGADALLLNLGNIQSYRIISMRKALLSANKNKVPVVLDLVGVSASPLRLNIAVEFIENYKIDIVKGNYSEITALNDKVLNSKGVDNEEDNKKLVLSAMESLYAKYNTCFIATGVMDYVFSRNGNFKIFNGTKMLTLITGTGCMIGAICASLLAFTDNEVEAALLSLFIMGIVGEKAERKSIGPGSFHMNLMDEIYKFNEKNMKEDLNWERILI